MKVQFANQLRSSSSERKNKIKEILDLLLKLIPRSGISSNSWNQIWLVVVLTFEPDFINLKPDMEHLALVVLNLELDLECLPLVLTVAECS